MLTLRSKPYSTIGANRYFIRDDVWDHYIYKGGQMVQYWSVSVMGSTLELEPADNLESSREMTWKIHVEWDPSENLRRPLNYLDSMYIYIYSIVFHLGYCLKMMGLGKCIPGFKYSIIFGYLFTKFRQGYLDFNLLCMIFPIFPAIFERIPWS